MKKFIKAIIIALVAAIIFALFAGCVADGDGFNKTLIDATYNYDTAIIQLANGDVVEVEVKSWSDYDGEQLQIVAKDGTIYLTSSFRCDLINHTN